MKMGNAGFARVCRWGVMWLVSMLVAGGAWGEETGTITTFAGTGTAGFSGDGGTATQGQLNTPFDVAFDANGNAYIADAYNHRIRRVDANGTLSTFAGTGSESFSGDGGPATQAALRSPYGVDVDLNGNVYFAGRHYMRIRRIDTAGIITTVAGNGLESYSGDGGPATQASLRIPVKVSIDAAGNMYIADMHNHRIRRVDSSGIITTIAGTGTAGFSGDGGAATQTQLNYPAGVAVDAAGNVYIADANNHRIRRIDSSGTIATIAGAGIEGFSGDGGVATQAQFNQPYDVVVDAGGGVLIADIGNNRVRRVDGNGNITTIAGIGSEGYSGDGGPAGQAQIKAPMGLGLDLQGNLYFAGNGNHVIRKVVLNGGSGNRRPTGSGQAVAVNAGSSVNASLSGSDADGDGLTYFIFGKPANGSVSLSGNTATYTPNAGFSGTGSFMFTVSDGKAVSAAATVSVTVIAPNDPPTAAAQTVGVDEGTSVSITLAGNDSNGDALTYAIANNPSQGSVSLSGNTATYTPNANYSGADSFTFTVNDGNATSAAATVTITVTAVNDAPTASTQSANVDEDGSIQITLAGNDLEDSALTYAIVAQSANGSLSLSESTATYTPNADYNGSDSFTFTVSDGQLTSSAATVSITVTGVNDAPSFTKGSDQTVNEDAGAQSVSVWTTGISEGPSESGQTLTFLVTNSNNALFSVQPSIDATGTLTYTPAADASGVATMTVKLQDNGGTANGGVDTSAEQTFTLTVTGVNDAPSFTKGSDQTVNEDAGAQSVSGWATALSPGPSESGQTLTFTVTNSNSGLFSNQPSIDATGTLTYTPAADVSGVATVSVQLQDNGGTANGGVDTSAEQTFTLTVNGVNDAPSFTKGADQMVAGNAGAQTVSGWATNISTGPADESDQTLTFIVTNSNSGLFRTQPSVDASGNLTYHTYSPTVDTDRSATVTVQLKDDGGTANGGVDTSAEQTFTITVDPPFVWLKLESEAVLSPGETYAVEWTGGDPDWNVNVYVSRVSTNATVGTIALDMPNSGSASWTVPELEPGEHKLYVENVQRTQWVYGPIFRIDAVPVVDDQTVSTNEDVTTQITLTGSDPEGASLTFTKASDPSHGSVSLSGATATYTPNADFNGSDSFTFTVSDGQLTSSAATVSITVTGANDAPSFTKGSDQTVNEDAGAQTVNGWATDISAGPADESGQTLTFTVMNSNNALFLSQPSIDASGTLTYSLVANVSGVATVTVKLQDNGGAANGGVDTSAEQTFTLTVNGVNDAPSFTKGADQTVNDDAGAQSVSGWATGISAGPSESGQTLTFVVTNGNNALFSVQPSIDASGTLTYTPAVDVSGTATVKVQLQDNGGTANGGVDTSAEQTFTITVMAVNRPPIAAAKSVEATEDSPIQITLSGSDEDGDALTYSVVTQPTQGGVSLSGNIATYTPNTNYNGADSFTFTVSDGQVTSAAETISVAVAAANDPPTLGDIASLVIDEDSGVQTVGLSFGPGGGGDESGQNVTASATSSNAALIPSPSISGSTLSFSLVANAHGSAALSVTANDGQITNGTVTKSFTVTVNPVNDVPSVSAQSVNSDEDSPVQIVLSGSDLDGDGLTYSVVTQPTQGSVTLSENTATYTPNANANGGDSFTFAVGDGQVTSAVASVSIAIAAVNDPPTLAEIAGVSILEDSGLQTVALDFGPGGGGDESGQNVTVSATSSNTALIPQPTVSGNVLSFTPVANGNGNAIITVTANDGQETNGTATRSFSVTVQSVNDPPTLEEIPNQNLQENAGLQELTLNFGPGGGADEAGQNVMVSAASSNTELIPEVIILGNALRFTPTIRASGNATITVTANDGQSSNGTTSRSFSVKVNVDNHAPVAADQSAELEEDGAAEIVLAGSDQDGDAMTYSIGTPPAHGQAILNGDRVTYTPSADFNGADSFTYAVSDGQETSAAATVSVTVNSVNDPPTLGEIPNRGIDEDAEAQTVSLIFGSGGGSDESGQTMTVSATSSNTALIAQPTVSGNILSFAPVAEANGNAVITVTVSDGQSNNGTTSRSFSVAVGAVNDPPVLGSIADQTIAEDTGPHSLSLNFGPGGGADESGQNVTVTGRSTDEFLIAAPTVSGNVLTYSPVSNAYGTAIIEVTVEDGQGSNRSTSRSFSVVITPVNDPPVLNMAQEEWGTEGKQLTLVLAATDADGDAVDFTAGSLPMGASMVNGTFNWTPTYEQSGIYEVNFTARDGKGGVGTGKVTILVQDGEPPGLLPLPARWNWGEVAVGATLERVFYLKNPAEVAAKVESFSLDSEAFSLMAPTPPVEIESLDSLRVEVRFKPMPGIEGVQTSVLQVVSDVGNFDVPLEGVGTWVGFEVEPTALDFGSVRVGETRSLTFTVSNPGNLPLAISVNSSSNNRFYLESSSFNVEGGKSREAVLTFAPTQEGWTNGTLVLGGNAGEERSLTLEGTGVRTTLSVSPPPPWDLGEAKVGERTSQVVVLRNVGATGMGEIKLEDVVSPFSVSPALLSGLAPGDSSLVTLSFDPVEGGDFADTLVVVGEGGTIEGKIAGRGLMAIPEIQDSLDFGGVQAGSTEELVLPIRNLGNDVLEIGNIQSTHPRFSAEIDQIDVEPGTVYLLTVHFSPTAEGRIDGTLIFTTNAGLLETLLLGEGGVANVAVHLEPSTFGTVRVGEEKQAKIIVENFGKTSVDIEQLEILPETAGLEILDLQVALLRLAPGDSLEIATLAYVPVEAAEIGAVTLRISGLAFEREVPVRGTGVAPPLPVLPEILDFSPVAVGEEDFLELEIGNAGGDTLHISEIESNRLIFSPSKVSMEISPGGTGIIEVHFIPDSEGEVTGRLTLVSDAPGSPHRLELRGRTPEGTPILQVVAPLDSLTFGVVPQGESKLQSLHLRNRGKGRLKLVLESEHVPFVPEVVDTIFLSAGQEKVVQVRFRPERVGWHQGLLLIRSNDPVVALQTLVMKGFGGGLFFEPASIQFGEAVIESRMDTTIQLINQTAESVRSSLELIGSGFTIDRQDVSLEPGEALPLQIEFHPRIVDRFSARLKVEGVDLELDLLGVGVDGPQIQIQPALGRDFGEVDIGQVDDAKFVLTNDGEGALKIYDLTVDKRVFQVPQAISTPLIIEPEERLVVEVLFMPLEEGEVSGLMTIVCNDPENPELVLPLKGKGVPGIEFYPRIEAVVDQVEKGLDFGLIDVGESGTQTLLIRNVGEAVLEVEQIEASERQIEVTGTPLLVAPGESRGVPVHLNPDPREDSQGILRILSNDPEEPLVRILYQYARPVAEFELLTEELHFGAAQEGQRLAPLALLNRGQTKGIVELFDESGTLRFTRDRLVVEPGQIGRTNVFYEGSSGSGSLTLTSNSPTQRLLDLPWEAESLLELVRSVPANGSIDVEQTTLLSLFFNEPLRQAGSQKTLGNSISDLLTGRTAGMVALQARIQPEPLNQWSRKLQVQENEVKIPLELEENQLYRLLVVGAEGESGADLSEPFEVVFSTGGEALPTGRLGGRVLFEDGSPLTGTVYLADEEGQIVGSTRIYQDGTFELLQVQEGDYRLFAREDGTGESFSHDRRVRVNAGEAVVGIGLTVPVQQEVVGLTPMAEKVEVEEAPELLADSTFSLPVYTGGVADLTGFTVQVSFNPEIVELVDVTANGPEEKNILSADGGVPLFLKRVVAEGVVEFGGSLLGPTADSAPDQGGLLAYFTFWVKRSDAEVKIERVFRRTMHGKDVLVDLSTIRPFGEEAFPGDFNGDGLVDFTDFFLFADAFGQTVPPADSVFDLMADGTIDFSDFFVFADHFGKAGGAVGKLMTLAREMLGLPDQSELKLNFPNPFNAETVIEYNLSSDGEARLEIFDVLGQRIKVLVATELPAGRYRAVWNGRDEKGMRVSSGVYFYRLNAGEFQQVRRMILLK